MDKAIDQSGQYESDIRIPTFGKTLLDISPPEYLLCRTDDEKHQEAQNPWIFTLLHSVDGIHLRAGEVKQKSREELSQPEYAPQSRRQQDSQDNVRHSEAKVLPPARTRPGRVKGQRHARAGHHHPEIDMRRCPWKEHHSPKNGRQAHAGDRFLHSYIT